MKKSLTAGWFHEENGLELLFLYNHHYIKLSPADYQISIRLYDDDWDLISGYYKAQSRLPNYFEKIPIYGHDMPMYSIVML